MRGEEIRRRAQGEKAERLLDALRQLDADFPSWADQFVFGEVWNRPGADFEDRMIVAITALAATGHTVQLRNYLHGALQAGIAQTRIHEWLAMLVPYVGFPSTVKAMTVWKEVSASHNGLSRQQSGGNAQDVHDLH